MRKLEINATLIQTGEWKGMYLIQVDGIVTKETIGSNRGNVRERNKKTNFEPVQEHPPDPLKAIWCPYCEWHMKDQSHTARKRLGQHIADIHHKKVAFPIGEEPPDLED